MADQDRPRAHSLRFPPQGAFVVQLTEMAVPPDEALHGRVEHVHSGESARFDSWQQLDAFMRDAMRRQQP